MAQLKVLDDPLVQKNYSSVDGCHIGVQIADTLKQSAYILVQQAYTSVQMADTYGYKWLAHWKDIGTDSLCR